MDFEKLNNLSDERKKELLIDVLKNDVSYWKKILILMVMIRDDEDTELLDMIIEHKIQEVNLANEKYNLGIINNDVTNMKDVRDYTKAMETILNDTEETVYKQACKQVLEVLKYIPVNYYNAISKKFLERLERMSDDNYTFVIEADTIFSNLNLLEEAKDILALISNKFWRKEDKIVNIEDIFNRGEE